MNQKSLVTPCPLSGYIIENVFPESFIFVSIALSADLAGLDNQQFRA